MPSFVDDFALRIERKADGSSCAAFQSRPSNEVEADTLCGWIVVSACPYCQLARELRPPPPAKDLA